MNKICTECKTEKNFIEFHKNKQYKDGYNIYCKGCKSQKAKANYRKHAEKEKLRSKLYREQYPEKVKEVKSNCYEKNKEHYTAKTKEYSEKNAKHIKEYKKRWYNKNKEKLHKQYKKIRDENPLIRLKGNCRSRILGAFKGRGFTKNGKSTELLGLDYKNLKSYLQTLFTEGMTWENMGKGGWEIDHIIPLSSAKTEAEMVALCHYTNLQPLWKIDNLRKGNKLI